MSTTPHISRRQLLALTAAAPMLGFSGLSAAQTDWPSKVIKLVVAFPAGGPTDTAARIVGQSCPSDWANKSSLKTNPAHLARLVQPVSSKALPMATTCPCLACHRCWHH